MANMMESSSCTVIQRQTLFLLSKLRVTKHPKRKGIYPTLLKYPISNVMLDILLQWPFQE